MTTAAIPPPAGLRERVLEAARAARAAGRALPEAPVVGGPEAFRRAAEAFGALLDQLEGDQWRVPALRGLDVQELVGHLIGVERDVHRALAGDPEVAGADHVASTQPSAQDQAGRPPEETRRAWRAAAARTCALVAGDGDPTRGVRLHGMRLPLETLLVVRAFELWTHENDIRGAVGLSATAPDASTLRLMTDLAVAMLPFGAARIGATDAVDVHLVLTGPGGGTWDLALGGGRDGGTEGVPEVAIVADAVGFCRLVGNRIGPVELDPHVTGAASRAAEVLAAAAALALD